MIVEDSNGLGTEQLPNRAAELRLRQSSRGGTSTSTAQSEETRRHRLQQRQQPMKMQQNYQSECWQRQPVGNKRLYAAPTSWGGSKAAVRLWALHCACTVALCTVVSPPMPLCSSTWPWHWARHCLPLSATTFVHQHRPLHSGIDHLVNNIFVLWLCNAYCTVDAKSSAR